MNTWVLIFFVLYGGTAVTTPTAEFNTKAACTAAAKDLEKKVKTLSPSLFVVSTCATKG